MNGEWCYFKSYFNKQQCEDIIERGLTIPPQRASIGVNGSNDLEEVTSVRRSTVRFLQHDDPKFKDLFDELWKMQIVANRDFFNFHVTKLDYIQLAEYDAAEQGEYKEHHDVFWMNNDPFFHRKISAVIQLSDPDDYEGGDLELTEPAEKPLASDLRLQGTSVFFPSFFRHKANPVTKGKRYSIAAWFDGPKWK